MQLTPWQVRAELNQYFTDYRIESAQQDPHSGRILLDVAGAVRFRATLTPEQGHRVSHGALPHDCRAQDGRAIAAWCTAAQVHLEGQGAKWPTTPQPQAREPISASDAARLLQGEWPQLQAWTEYVRLATGSAVRWLQQGDLVLLELPTPPQRYTSNYRFLLSVSDAFGRGSAVPPWMHALGFGSNASGDLQVVPTPSGFVRAVRQQAGKDPAYLPSLTPMNWMLAWERPWLDGMCRGRAVINMPPQGFYRRTGWLRHRLLMAHSPGLRRGWHGLLVIPGHDLTLHCLLQHRIPQEHVRQLGEPILRHLHATPGPYAPKPLCAFFEDDLSRHCQALWRTCVVAADFDLAWLDQWPLLLQKRDARLAQASEMGWQGGWIAGDGLHLRRQTEGSR